MQITGIDTILRGIDIALDRRKIALAFGGIVSIIIGAGLFFYLSILVGQDNLVIGAAFSFITFLVMYFLWAFFSGAITHMSWQDLTNNQTPSPLEALSFSGQNIGSFLLSPLVLVLVVVAAVLVQVVLLLIGRVPYLGELIVSLLLIPLVLVNALLLVGVVAGSWLIFPIIAERRSGVAETIERVVEIIRREPGRLASYLIIAFVMIFLVILILWPLVAVSYGATLAVMVAGVGGEKMDQISSGATWAYALFSADVMDIMWRAAGAQFGPEPPATMRAASFFFNAGTVILFAGVFYAFPWVFTQTVYCAIYASLSGASGPSAAPAPSPSPPYAGANLDPPETTRWPGPPAAPAPSPSPPYAGANPDPPETTRWPGPSPSPLPDAGSSAACIGCNRPLKPGSRFCPYCGAKQQ